MFSYVTCIIMVCFVMCEARISFLLNVVQIFALSKGLSLNYFYTYAYCYTCSMSIGYCSTYMQILVC